MLPSRFLVPIALTIAMLGTDHIYAQVTLRQKIGQLLMLGFNGTTLDDTIKIDLAERNLGGVIIMGWNTSSPAQIAQLTASIRALAPTPPLIATDEEGGYVARLGSYNGYAATYSAYQLGTIFHSTDSTYRQASTMAGWLADAGISVDLAPVADVNVNPQSPAIGALDRSFSSNPLTVSAHVQAFTEALRARKVIGCLKHFPGHGSAGTDSHLTLPDITNTWADSELIPYREGVAANSIDMVMVGHLYDARIDSVYPTSISAKAIDGLLRDSVGYHGVVITDDLYGMRAITDRYGFGETAVRAINAGVDILLYISDDLNGVSLCRHLIDTIEANVNSGAISLARIDEAYGRVTALKQKYIMAGFAEGNAEAGEPARAVLYGNYPNPFNPSTTIEYAVAGTRGQGLGGREVRIVIYDLLGREVATLVDARQAPGTYQVSFDGSRLASGVYFCRMTAGDYAATKAMILQK